MNKIKIFLNKAVVDEAAKKEITEILGDKKLVEATDEQLAKISGLSQKLGVDITIEEIKDFAGGGMELADEELDAVAGGFDSEFRPNNAEDWYELISFAVYCAKRNGTDFQAEVAVLAKRHHFEPDQLYKNLEWFKAMGFLPKYIGQ